MIWKHALAAGVAAATLFGSSAIAVSNEPERLGGSDRYATSVEISKATFPTTSSLVFLASGETYADALVAGAAAGSKNAPVLLTREKEIPAVVRAELTRLEPATIVIVGGRAAVSPAVAEDAKEWGVVERWSGANRYATAKRVAQELFSDTATKAVLASGEDFPDALAGGVSTSVLDGPLLLTKSSDLAAETIDYLKGLNGLTEIVILGGKGAVSDKAAAAAGTFAKTTRRAGANRFATSVQISGLLFPGQAQMVVLANGNDFPDALSGTPLAAAERGPVLLVRPTSMPAEVCTEIQRLSPGKVFALGGKSAVSDAVVEAAKKCATPKSEPDPSITAGPAAGSN
ncbi:MAG TPA: cell wall-binding repeat-containing protein [Intrasporangiaceae bacterium]|nr:cell wall-binding repeat-containing protein [Intrasporangiaceae bacterium]